MMKLYTQEVCEYVFAGYYVCTKNIWKCICVQVEGVCFHGLAHGQCGCVSGECV